MTMDINLQFNNWDEVERFAERILKRNSSVAPVIHTPPIDVKVEEPITVNTQPTTDMDEVEEGAPVAEGTLDKNGLPWDERIHSSSKKMTSKNVWARRKNLTDAYVDQVESELRARQMTAAAPVVQPFPQFAPSVPVTQPVMAQQPVTPMMPAQQPQPVMVQQPQQVAVVNAAPNAQVDFNGLMNIVSGLFTSGVIDKNYMDQLPLRVGVTQITDIAASQPHIDQVIHVLRQDGKIQ